MFAAESLLRQTDLIPAVINLAAIANTTVVAGVTGTTIRVHRLRLNVAAAQSVTVLSGATVLEVLNFTAAGFHTLNISSRPWYTTAAGQDLKFTLSTVAQTNGVLEYVQSLSNG
jgi:hypothetical protein